MKKKFNIKVIIVNVVVVFLVFGFLKNGMVLLIVLILVKEEELEENVCKIKVIEIFGIIVFGNVVVCNGIVFVMILYNLIMISNEIIRINVYIGNNRNDVDFFRLWRFSIISSKMIVIEIVIWCLYNVGIVDVIVLVFVEIDIVIVNM